MCRLWYNIYMEERRIPLAQRMRPENFDEFVGQSHIAKKGSLFRRAIEAGTMGSAIFLALRELVKQRLLT